MANAKGLKLCPRCEVELPEKPPENCPACGYLLISPQNRYYAVPDYTYFQQADLKAEAENQYQKTEGKKKAQEIKEIEGERVKFWRECSDEVRIAAVQDCLSMMREALVSKADVESLRKITAAGKQIGELSKIVEGWFSNGGSHYGTQLPNTTPGEANTKSTQSS